MDQERVPISPADLRETLEELKETVAWMHRNLTSSLALEKDAAAARAELREAETARADAENSASMEAYAQGVVDGKNAEIRAMQMTAFLNAHPNVRAARETSRLRETTFDTLLQGVQEHRDWYKQGGYRLSALRSRVELLTALINARLAEINTETDEF